MRRKNINKNVFPHFIAALKIKSHAVRDLRSFSFVSAGYIIQGWVATSGGFLGPQKNCKKVPSKFEFGVGSKN
jgi:hypothetical protein